MKKLIEVSDEGLIGLMGKKDAQPLPNVLYVRLSSVESYGELK